jgi:hypothetical protein
MLHAKDQTIICLFLMAGSMAVTVHLIRFGPALFNAFIIQDLPDHESHRCVHSSVCFACEHFSHNRLGRNHQIFMLIAPVIWLKRQN